MARLADMASTGIPVPPGFAIDSRAFLEAIGPLRRDHEALQCLSGENASADGDLEAACRRATQIMLETPLLPPLRREISHAYELLSEACGRSEIVVAVRSSALGEDAEDASFAGQYESYLGITGAEELLRYVQAVWASAFSVRATQYRQSRHIPIHRVPMAVGVMQLIDARSSGVAFSVDPVSGKSDRVVAESAWGLGEAVVQGCVEPDRFEIDKVDLRVLRTRIGSKARRLNFDPEAKRSTWREVPLSRQSRPSVDVSELQHLTRIVGSLEEQSGHPVDVEWVVSRQHPAQTSRLFIVQCRPISRITQASPDVIWSPALSIR